MNTPRDERQLTLLPRPANGGGLAPMVGQILFMPLTMMIYGLNLLARTAGASAGAPAAPRPRAVASGAPDAFATPAPRRDRPLVAAPEGWSTLQPGWRRPNLELVRSEASEQPHQHDRPPSERYGSAGSEEQRRMVDNKNLQDDMLKTVRYWVSFEKRDYEAVLYDSMDHVYDNLTDAQFTAWKMAEFMQKLRAGRIPVPYAWQDKRATFYTADESQKDADGKCTHLVDFDHKDKKYLTVDWEVVGRVVRRKGRFDERKTEALETIAQNIERFGDGKITGTLVEGD